MTDDSFDACLLSLFEAGLSAYPDNTAIEYGNTQISYQQLNCLSLDIADAIRREASLGSAPIAIHAHRSPELVAAILGVLRAGRAFAVLDDSHPPDRLKRQADMINPALVIGAGGTPSDLSLVYGRPSINCSLDSLKKSEAVRGGRLRSNKEAYYLFTSGTMGRPKCIRTGHAPLIHFAQFYARTFKPSADDRFSFLSGVGHDPMLRDLFIPMTTGATICIPPEQSLRDPQLLFKWLGESRITIAHVTPQLIKLIAVGGRASRPLQELRYVFSGGDILYSTHIDILRQVAPSARVVNFYGASETPQAMCYHIVGNGACDERLPLGKAIGDVEILVLDDAFSPVERAEIGQIAIRTKFLSHGYVGGEEAVLVFLDGGADPDVRTYLTGDRGYFREDGNLIGIGRIDNQVKVRGYRVELSEIESAIRNLSFVDDVTVVASMMPNGENSITAYVALQGHSSALSSKIRDTLQGTLPSYMVPQDVIIIPSIPLLSNNKIDHAALRRLRLDPCGSQFDPAFTQSTLMADRSVNEGEGHGDCGIQEAFRSSFGDRARDRSASFLSLGGDSLNYLLVALALEDVLGELPNQWETRSIAELARRANALQPCPPRLRSRTSRYSAAANFDTLRGLACLLVVAFHVVGNDAATGLRLGETSRWHPVMDSLNFIRMPLFTAIAGYLYALMPTEADEYSAFIRRKAIMLMVPALFVGTVTWALRLMVYGPDIGLVEALLHGYVHLWYLYALMGIFILVGLMDAFWRPSSPIWVLSLALVLSVYPLVPQVRLFSLWGTVWLLPYFVFGLLLCRDRDWASNRVVTMGAAMALAGILLFQIIDVSPPTMLMGVATLATIFFLFRVMPRIPALAWIGAYSFTIYLWHPVANAAIRNLLWHHATLNVAIMFGIGVLSGVAIPIAIQKLVGGKPFISLPITGARTTPSFSNNRPSRLRFSRR